METLTGTNAASRNGRTPGITLPSAEFQEAVIRKAYSAAGLDFSGTDYVECHGTGTAVGDPIEVEALGRCFSEKPRDTPLLLGSVSLPTTIHHYRARDLTDSMVGEIQPWTQRGCQWPHFLDQSCSRVSTLRHTTYAGACCIEPKKSVRSLATRRRLDIVFLTLLQSHLNSWE